MNRVAVFNFFPTAKPGEKHNDEPLFLSDMLREWAEKHPNASVRACSTAVYWGSPGQGASYGVHVVHYDDP